MTPARPAEETAIHTRLLRFTLGIDESRAYWAHVDPDDGADTPARALTAFEHHWFGTRTQARVEGIVGYLRPRYDAFPEALGVLRRWPRMDPDTRRAICHWHTQLADPLYRTFTGDFLVARRGHARPTIDRDRVVGWVDEVQPGRWAASTRIQWASKLLSAAHEAGLVGGTRDPRPLTWPRVPDAALAYLLHLLRGVDFEGALLDNPYLASVGLTGPALDDRLRTLPGVEHRRMGDLTEMHWAAPDLDAWAGEALA